MFEPRPIPAEAIPAALEKAKRYRLLNEPLEAESICRDVLRVEPEHHEALVTLLLALSDQFRDHPNEKYEQAQGILQRLTDEYDLVYYAGILCERRAKVAMRREGPHAGYIAYDWLRRAMDHYEKASALRPGEVHGDPILRWNTCVRILKQRPDLQPMPEEPRHEMLE